VDLTVTSVNDTPTATDDAITTSEDTPVTFDPRTNDGDVDGDSLTITEIDGSAITVDAPVTVTGGTVGLNSDGTLTFLPDVDFHGAPSFDYTVSDDHGGTATATVDLTVTSVNDAPTATAIRSQQPRTRRSPLTRAPTMVMLMATS
jgi:hypothetical protein